MRSTGRDEGNGKRTREGLCFSADTFFTIDDGFEDCVTATALASTAISMHSHRIMVGAHRGTIDPMR